MYIPKQFQVNDLDTLTAFVRDYSFGTLFSQTNGEPFATHLPFLIQKDESGEYYLLGHMARSNPHWRSIENQVLVVFQGPHSYISPSWYQEEHTVPTWNYVSTHIYGHFMLVDEPSELESIIYETINHYESSMEKAWETDLSNHFNSELMNMIIGFKIKIERFEGKWKLSQNHSVERRKRVIQGLRQMNDSNSRKIAELMNQDLMS